MLAWSEVHICACDSLCASCRPKDAETRTRIQRNQLRLSEMYDGKRHVRHFASSPQFKRPSKSLRYKILAAVPIFHASSLYHFLLLCIDGDYCEDWDTARAGNRRLSLVSEPSSARPLLRPISDPSFQCFSEYPCKREIEKYAERCSGAINRNESAEMGNFPGYSLHWDVPCGRE